MSVVVNRNAAAREISLELKNAQFNKIGSPRDRRTERPYRKTTKTDKLVTVCTNTHFWSRYKV